MDNQMVTPASIKVIGVGGGGCNAVERMITRGIKGVDFVTVNTDSQALARSSAETRLMIGPRTTRGLGSGGVPKVGRAAAEESATTLQSILSGADMAFITAGMGGGTGTGAAPVVARVAKELGVLTVGIVTTPFSFEGKRRHQNAAEGITALHKEADTIIVVSNDRLLSLVGEQASLQNAFGMADDVLYHGIRCISDLITVPGLINLDFADVRSVMKDGGAAMMSIGVGKGEDRGRVAAEAAMMNPLLEVSCQGATGILLNVTGGPDMSIYEVNEAATIIRNMAHPDANIIFGASVDPDLDDEIRISLVTTGLEKTGNQNKQASKQSNTVPDRAQKSSYSSTPVRSANYGIPATSTPVVSPQAAAIRKPEEGSEMFAGYPSTGIRARELEPEEETLLVDAGGLTLENLDIPAFLRKKLKPLLNH